MNQKLRSLILVAFIVIPALSFGQVVANFTSNIRSGCLLTVPPEPLYVKFTDSSTTTPGHSIHYKWWFIRDSASIGLDTVTVSDTVQTINQPFSETGHFTVIERVYDSTTGDSSTKVDTDYIFVSAPLNVNFKAYPYLDTNFGCKGDKVTFINTTNVFPGQNFYFTWLINGDTIAHNVAFADSPAYIFSAAGHYDTWLILDSSSSPYCLNNTYKSSYINIDTFPTVSFYTSNHRPCAAPAIDSFASTSINAGSYLWKFGDGATSTLSNPKHTYTHSGSFNDTLIAYSNFGSCPASKPMTNNVVVGGRTFGFIVTSAFGDTTTIFCSGDAIIVRDTATLDTTALGTDSIIIYRWHDDGVSSSTDNPAYFNSMHAMLSAGVHTITDSIYTIQTNTAVGCYGKATRTVTINPLPVVSITPSITYWCSVPFADSFSATISAGTGTPPYQYLWDFGNTDTSTASNPVYTYTLQPVYSVVSGTGYYTPTVTVTDSNGCMSSTPYSNNIYIGPPTFHITASIDSGCTPFAFSYTTSIDYEGSNPIPYTIDSITFTDSASSLMTDTTYHFPPQIGTDTLTVASYNDIVVFYYHIDTSFGSCTGYTDTIRLHLGGVHTDLSGITLPDSVCPNTAITFHNGLDSTQPNSSFKWSFNTGGAFRYIWHDTVVAYATPGYKYITAIASLNGCNDTLKIHDTVKILNPSLATITITRPVCSDSGLYTYNFSGGGITGLTGVRYSWAFGDGSTATGQNVVYTYPSANTTYTITLIDSFRGCTNIDTTKLSVFPFSYSNYMGAKDTLLCKGKVDSFYGPLVYNGSLPSTTFVNYVWHWGDADGDSTFSTASNNISHTYSLTGNFAPFLVVKTKYGCHDTVFSRTNNTDSIPYSYIHVGGPSGGVTATPTWGLAPLIVNFTDNTIDSFTINKRYWYLNNPAIRDTTDTVITGSVATASDTFPEGSAPFGYIISVLYDTDVVGCYIKYTDTVRSQTLHAYFTDSVHVNGASVNINGSLAGCIGLTYYFHDTNSNCSYTWNFGDGTTGTGQNPTHTYADTGKFAVSVIDTALAGGFMFPGAIAAYTYPDSMVIKQMHVSYNLNVTDTNVTCPPIFINAVNTTTAPPGGYTYQWYFSPLGVSAGGVVATGSLPLHTLLWNSGTTTTISLIAESPLGCLDTASHAVHIGGPAGYIKISKSVGCLPLLSDTLTFVDTNGSWGSITNITWYMGDGYSISSGDSMIVHSYTDTGTFHPYIYVNGSSCPNIYIPPPPADTTGVGGYSIHVYKLVATVATPPIICFGSSTTLWANGAGSMGTYAWTPNMAISCDSCDTLTANPRMSTTYTVIATTSNGCSDTITTTVHVDDSLYTHITGSNSMNSFCLHSADTLYASGSTGTLSWLPAGVLSCTNCDTVITTPPSTTTVRLTVTDSIGCHIADSLVLTVKPIPALSSAETDSVCNNMPLVYVPASTDTATTFAWTRATVAGISNPPGANMDTISETLNNTTAGTVQVLYIYNVLANGCSSSDTVSVAVYPTPLLIDSSLNYSICSGSAFSFTDSSLTAGTVFTWHRDSIAGIAPVMASGTGNITDTLTNASDSSLTTWYAILVSANTCTSMDTVHLTVNPIPALGGSLAIAPVCNNDSVIYHPVSTVAGASINWRRDTVPGISNTTGTGIGSIGEILNDTAHSSITVTYVYTVSAAGCSTGANIVSVLVRPTSHLTNSHSDTLCSGNTFIDTLNSLTTDTLTYSWTRLEVGGIDPYNNESGSGNIISEVLKDSSSTHPITTRYYDTINNHGCINIDTVKVLVVVPGTPSAIVAGVTGNLGGVLCANTLYQNFGAANPPAAGTPYTWSTKNGNATIAGVGNTSQYCFVNFNTAGSDTIMLTSGIAGFGCNTSSTFPVTIVSQSVDNSTKVIYYENNLYCLNNGEQSYQWGYDSIGSLKGFIITGETYQNYYLPVLDTINKHYWVETKNDENCKQKYYFSDQFLEVPNINKFIPGGINIFPNPATGEINIELNASLGSSVQFEIVNLLGQKLITVPAVDNKAMINISALPNGSYFVESYIDGNKNRNAIFIKN